MFDGRWRKGVDQGLKPIGSSIRRTGITANHLTASGLVLAVACAVAVGSGRLGLGLVLLVASALPDMLDGAVAKASGTASPRGAFFDSVADRVTDSLVLGGIAWYLADTDGGLAAMLPFAVLATSTLISYERAKAESLGYAAKGGLMERAERIVTLGIGLAFSALLVPVLWLMLVLTSITAVQRFAKVWRQASAPRSVRADSRWRAWRALAADRSSRTSRATLGSGWRTRRQEALSGSRSRRRGASSRRP